MSYLSVANLLLFILFALVHGSRSLDYVDLETLGVSCPTRDSCDGYQFDKNYTQRSCECDSACTVFGDCCIDYRRRSSSIRRVSNGLTCLNIGPSNHTGVYTIGSCSSSWSGLQEIRDKCEGPDDFSDPLLSTPVVTTAQAVAYKNRYCAQCNNAVLASLKLFQIRLQCDGALQDMSDVQILADITYNETYQTWGVNRLNAWNETTFYFCKIIFDVPSHLNRSVRYCRANHISTCHPAWSRTTVRNNCAAYMAVVYDDELAYRNPHCAICNYKSLNDIGCISDISGRKPVPFSHYLDINMDDGERVGVSQVTTPSCPSGQIYDPFFKKCKHLVCAIPGHMLVNNQCVSP